MVPYTGPCPYAVPLNSATAAVLSWGTPTRGGTLSSGASLALPLPTSRTARPVASTADRKSSTATSPVTRTVPLSRSTDTDSTCASGSSAPLTAAAQPSQVICTAYSRCSAGRGAMVARTAAFLLGGAAYVTRPEREPSPGALRKHTECVCYTRAPSLLQPQWPLAQDAEHCSSPQFVRLATGSAPGTSCACCARSQTSTTPHCACVLRRWQACGPRGAEDKRDLGVNHPRPGRHRRLQRGLWHPVPGPHA